MTSVGVIGLGQMGLPMARNLMKAGFPVVGYRRGDASDFAAAGGKVAGSVREVAESCEVILCCLPSAAALEEVVDGPRGLAAGDCAGRVLVELSTLDTKVKRRMAGRLAERGGEMLDCAISGIPRMMEERAGVVFVSGAGSVAERVQPQFDAISAKVFYMGPFGAALNAKLCANMLVAINIAATAETLTFGRKLGIDPMRLYEALKDGAGGSLQFTARGGRMAAHDWDKVMGSTATLAKDIGLIEARGAETGCPIPVLSAAAELYGLAMAEGHGDRDVAAVYASAVRRAGLDDGIK